MICADTSVWIASLRGGAPALQLQLQELLDTDAVLLPVIVRLELLAGIARGQQARLQQDLSAVPAALPTADTWARIERWLIEWKAARPRFGLPDLIIAALAAERGAAVWSLDQAFLEMAELGWIQLYRPPG